MTLWHGRFGDGPADELLAFTVSLPFDRLLAGDDLTCSRAHVRGLQRGGILTDEELTVILVPTDKGPLPAHFGDWIVRRGEGDHYPCSPEEFALRHEPLT
jgi:hypothetical protein